MKIFNKITFSGILLILITLGSCTPEDGMDGEMGLQGIQGIQGEPGADGVDGTNGVDGVDGADGVDGVDGADGQDGNFNVFASDWIEPGFSMNEEGQEGWTESYDSPLAIEFFQEAPQLTQEILDSGVVLVYGQFDDGSD